MSFVVNQEWIVYQRNLGRNTKALAMGLIAFNPDAGWKQVQGQK